MVFASAGNSKPKITTAKNPGVPEGRTVNNLRFQPEEVLHHEAKTPEGFPHAKVQTGKTENHQSKNRESLISGVPEGHTVNNLRFQPEAQHEAKTREGFPQLVKRCIFHPTLSHVPRVKPEVHPQRKLFYDAPSDSLYN